MRGVVRKSENCSAPLAGKTLYFDLKVVNIS